MPRAIVPLCTLVAMLVLCFLFHAAVNDAKDKPLTLNVRPRMAFAPADLSIFIRLVPAEDDRFLRVWTDGMGYSRSSEWSLEGSKSARTYTVEWRRIFPADDYDIIASVSDYLHKIRASETQRVILTGPNH